MVAGEAQADVEPARHDLAAVPLHVLAVVDHYLPGFKAGGPVMSISRLVTRLSGEIAFDVATADRDLGDERPYPGIRPGSWQLVEGARVRYLQPDERTFGGWLSLLRRGGWDLVYLNSFFSGSTIRILILRRLGLLPPTPLLLAPRGELHEGALSLKRGRKAAWVALSRRLRLYTDVRWHAATDKERDDIARVVGRGASSRVTALVAPDVATAALMPAELRSNALATSPPPKRPGHLRVAFVSRICRNKNLDYALRVLSAVGSGHIEFDIYGPIQDARYWRRCQVVASRLPRGVTVHYGGPLRPESVCSVLAGYDLFFLPTRGESFGHVVVEALIAGCPVLISDQTPWRDLAAHAAGWEAPLDDPARFTAVISTALWMDAAEHARWRDGARRLGEAQGREPDVLEASRQLFHAAAGRAASALVSTISEVPETTG